MAVVAKDSTVRFYTKTRMSFPHLAKGQPVDKDDPEKGVVYSAQLNTKKEDWANRDECSELREACEELAKEAFGKNWKLADMPWHDGDDEVHEKKISARPENRSCMVINVKSYDQPIGMAKLNKKGEVIELEKHEQVTEMYAGCYVVMSYTLYAYRGEKGKTGVSVGARNLVKVADGEKLVAKTNVVSDFATGGIDMSQYTADASPDDGEEEDLAAGV